MTEALLIALLIVGIANIALTILLISSRRDAAREIDRLKRDMLDEQRALRAEVSENTRRSINAVGETLLNEYQRDTLNQEQRFKTFALENAQRMEQIRRSVERQLADIREDNGKKLDEMRSIVDEKLQKTLEDKLSRSFALVSERLEQVYKGLGEMDPDQLWETTMDPATRTLLQVNIDDAAEAERTVSELMGDQVEPRKEFIQKHARDVRFLDI